MELVISANCNEAMDDGNGCAQCLHLSARHCIPLQLPLVCVNHHGVLVTSSILMNRVVGGIWGIW
jgi:hypothetical protein